MASPPGGGPPSHADYQPLTRPAGVGQGGAAVTSESWEYTGGGRGRYQQVETYGQVEDPLAENATDDPECPLLLPVKAKDGEFLVSVARSTFDEPLGIFVHESEDEHALEVLRIATGTGPVNRWNAAHPDRKIQRGDRIVAVNGVSGDGPRLREEIERQGGPDLVLAVRRQRRRGAAGILWCLKSSGCALLVLLFAGLALWMEASKLSPECCGRLSGFLGVGFPCQADDESEPEPTAAVAKPMLGAGVATTATTTSTATTTAPTTRTSQSTTTTTAATLTSLPYNCSDGGVGQATWPNDKRDWCCRAQSLGCATTTPSSAAAPSTSRATPTPAATTSCVELGADYSPSMEAPRYFPRASTAQQHRDHVIACLKLCANTTGCAHFTYEIVAGSCRMAEASATLARGIPLTVSGPPRCSSKDPADNASSRRRSLLLTEEANWDLLR